MELPASFVDYTRTLLGDEEYQKLAESLNEEQPVSIRINANKLEVDKEKFNGRVPWCTTGYYLDNRLTFTFDPLFHAGAYYVQEASSMFVEQAFRQYNSGRPVVVLDLCAAPGGKSTLARTIMHEGGLLVANEVVRNRSQILAENMIKWGHPDVVVTNNEPADFAQLEEFFDMILIDAPCSGEGMFRKDPGAVSEWSPENVETCRERQRRIIKDIWPSLKAGGVLFYSTCTYNLKENEENIRWILDEFDSEILPLDTGRFWNVGRNQMVPQHFPVYRFWPHKVKGEGFFLAAIYKPTGYEVNPWDPNPFSDALPPDPSELKKDYPWEKLKKPQKKEPKPSDITRMQVWESRDWIVNSEDYEYIVDGNSITAFHRNLLPDLNVLRSTLHVVHAGIAVAELKGKKIMPTHGLAMSMELNKEVFATEEISYEQAIAYLRKEAITLPTTAPRGVVLLTYKGVPLGFVKNVGNRANNLYPLEWRIRSGYMPEEIKILDALLQ